MYGEKTSADADHFYPDSLYPNLRLNLFNLIPSCQMCNMRFKKSFDPYVNGMIYPYEEEFGSDAIFIIDSINEEYLLSDHDDYVVKFNISSTKAMESKINNSIDRLQLDKLYRNSHNNLINEIITKKKRYSESTLLSITTTFPELSISVNELKNDLYGTYQKNKEENNRKPLTKLTSDIIDFLDGR